MSNSADSGVAIVGGGMVGVTLALLIAKAAPELSVTLLEAAKLPPALAPDQSPSYTPSFDARNTALSRRSIEAFKDLGVWSELAPHATPIHQIHVSDKGHFGMARLSAAEENVDRPTLRRRSFHRWKQQRFHHHSTCQCTLRPSSERCHRSGSTRLHGTVQSQ